MNPRERFIRAIRRQSVDKVPKHAFWTPEVINLVKEKTGFDDPTPKAEETFKVDTRLIGLNFEPSVGYSTGIGLIFTLGFRYQWLRTEYLDDFPGEDEPLPDANDYLYGVFVSVLYSF